MRRLRWPLSGTRCGGTYNRGVSRKVLSIGVAIVALTLFGGAALASTASGSAQSQTSLFVDVIPEGNSASEIGGVDDCVEAGVGDTFIVDIGVKDVAGLTAWETTLVFDQSILEVVGNDARMLLASGPGSRVTVQSDLEPPTDFYPTGGLFIGAADSKVSAAESGSGVLARITFRAIAPGVSEASMPQLDLDGNGTTDKGPRLLGPGGEDDPIADVNGDSYFDADVANALISVGGDCSSAPPPSTPTPPPTPAITPTPVGQTPTPTGTVGGDTGTPFATSTPTGAPATHVVWGDNNCSQQVDPLDSLFVLRGDAGLPTDTGDCPGMGADIEVPGASPHIWGDVDCKDGMTPVDSLKVLRFDAGLGVPQTEGCPGMGTSVSIIEG